MGKGIAGDYVRFISECKTERLCVRRMVAEAEKAGFANAENCDRIKPGDRVYVNKMGKALVLFSVGGETLSAGMNILGAHIDSPRLDVKMNPVYEKEGLVYFNTHYYGGIKKYQWPAIPLALYGVVCLKDGRTVDVAVGDGKGDPVFCISDILPHLADRQMKKSASEFIDPEKLDVIVGCASKNPDGKKDGDDKEKDAGKKNVLKLLKKKYGMEEDDFLSAEIEVVPAGDARFMGFDESMILGYGQDDRACAYASFRAFMDACGGKRTSALLLSDKEEIGSYGATGMSSRLLDNAVFEVASRMEGFVPESTVRHCLCNSHMLSSDVNAAYDPLNDDLYDRQNASALGEGFVFNKYTGSRGKSGASDANPEYIAKLRAALDAEKVKYQFAELGRVGVGGGGTIALYAAEFGMNVIDAGVSVLSMHAPWEIVSVNDLEMAYKGYKAFVEHDFT